MATQPLVAVPLEERIRLHEAGHAAVALYVGFTLSEVSTIAYGNSGGHVTPASHASGNRSLEAFWAKAIMAYAGASAEKRFCGGVGAAGAEDDMRMVQEICSALARAGFQTKSGAEISEELMSEAQELSDTYVEIVAGQILELAAELTLTPCIDGVAAAEIYIAAGR